MRSMTLILYSAFLLLLTATGLPGADIQHVVFDSHARTREKFSTEYVPTLMHEFPVSEHKWPLRDLNPDLPSDWSPFKFLVMEVKASTAQRFLLRLYTADGMRALRFHQFGGGVWIRAAVPLSYFQSQSQEGQDLAAVFNKSRNPFWMAVVGPFGPIKAVQSLAVAMVAPVGNPTLDIRSVRLSNDDPGSEILDKLPVVDEFGQWIPAEYPGKIKNLEQLKSDWDREDKSLRPGDSGYCKYGGFANTKATQLILHYYGEEPDAADAEMHLDQCAECRELYGSLQRVLNVVDTLPVPARSPEYGAEVWRRMEHRLPARRRWAFSVPWRWAAAAVALASLLVAAFQIGRAHV